MFTPASALGSFFFIVCTGSAALAQTSESLLFVSDRGDGKTFQIYAMDPDGANQKKLTQGDAIEVDPVFSPDRTRIALVVIERSKESRRSTVVVMNRDGSGRKRLTDENELAFSPAWSPDGKRIVYSVVKPDNRSPDAALVVRDADGGNRKQIGSGLLPSWSPDGKRIAYSVFKDGRPTVHVMDADGSNAKPLIKGMSMMAVWSPDGKRIAYMGEGVEGSDQPDLFVMNADGSDAKQLTMTSLAANLGPVWSADSQRIYFTRYSKFIADESAHVFVISADGGDPRQLTKAGVRNFTGGTSLLMMFSAGSDEAASDAAKPAASDKKPSRTDK